MGLLYDVQNGFNENLGGSEKIFSDIRTKRNRKGYVGSDEYKDDVMKWRDLYLEEIKRKNQERTYLMKGDVQNGCNYSNK
jgi:hypothetical protein